MSGSSLVMTVWMKSVYNQLLQEKQASSTHPCDFALCHCIHTKIPSVLLFLTVDMCPVGLKQMRRVGVNSGAAVADSEDSR